MPFTRAHQTFAHNLWVGRATSDGEHAPPPGATLGTYPEGEAARPCGAVHAKTISEKPLTFGECFGETPVTQSDSVYSDVQRQSG